MLKLTYVFKLKTFYILYYSVKAIGRMKLVNFARILLLFEIYSLINVIAKQTSDAFENNFRMIVITYKNAIERVWDIYKQKRSALDRALAIEEGCSLCKFEEQQCKKIVRFDGSPDESGETTGRLFKKCILFDRVSMDIDQWTTNKCQPNFWKTNEVKYKIPGCVGDSSIVGAGAYADQRIGIAASTGDGDIIMRFCQVVEIKLNHFCSFLAVEEMRYRASPMEAAKKAIGAACNEMFEFPYIATPTLGLRSYFIRCQL
ncbi:N(4)-(Beta-N-acetylglucosaminyl)-L-asparaginase [Atta colombica]|uniref:N(4)-(Beta-N-acetylglucosaminyl)-L-asparaginase n=1 Tax=Atta colombica TaxID=520822 RepID=A0A195B5S6_9HYME|nr:N(4)-(Beta-N-acetylglucosaminyl)-L-asparaginase [Atta colombica]